MMFDHDSMDNDQTMRAHHERWHLKKEINVGHMITTLIMAIGLVAWGSNMDRRLTRVEVSASDQSWTDQKQDIAIRDSALSLTTRLDRIDSKLDRLIESLIPHK